MSNTTANIKNSWSLIAFKDRFDKMQVGNFKHTDEVTGDVSHFKSCIFHKGDSITFVAFSPKLGELTPQQIVNQKDDLQVVEWETEDKHGYTLCNKGQNAWEDVNF